MEHEGDGDTNYNWCTWKNPKRIRKGTGRMGIEKTSREYPDECIIKIDQNTEKSPGDLRRFTVTQISDEKPSANAGGKNSQRCKIMDDTHTELEIVI